VETFSEYRLRDEVARELIAKGLDPREFVRTYLGYEEVVCEGAFGNFFRRLGSAWDSFWTKPNENPTDYLGTAKKALGELMQVVQGQKQAGMDSRMVLTGLQQAIKIIDRVDPYIKKLDPGETPTKVELPPDLKKNWDALHDEMSRVVAMSDADQRKQQLLGQADDRLLAFIGHLEDLYQSISPNDAAKTQYRDQIGGFLRYLDQSSEFQQFQLMMSQARTSGTDESLERPQGWDRVVSAYQNALANKQNPEQVVSQLYASLLDNHPLKVFIQREARYGPSRGQPEAGLLAKYAKQWATKYQHHSEDR
jgi:hypothetical protein